MVEHPPPPIWVTDRLCLYFLSTELSTYYIKLQPKNNGTQSTRTNELAIESDILEYKLLRIMMLLTILLH